jgi:hypothetical protein
MSNDINKLDPNNFGKACVEAMGETGELPQSLMAVATQELIDAEEAFDGYEVSEDEVWRCGKEIALAGLVTTEILSDLRRCSWSLGREE